MTVEISVAGGSASQVDHYLLTLQQDGAPVAMVGNSVTLGPQAPIAPFNSTFNAVPNGSNYSILVDGWDACGGSVATGAVTSAAFDIVNGAVSNQPNPIP